jgi:hypothetical protein
MSVDFQKAAKAGVEAGLNQIGKSIEENFDKRQGQFKPLVAATIKRRHFLGFDPAPILVASGTLKEHIADEHSDITTSGSITSGTISPSKTATPDYGKEPISTYAGALNSIREFWLVDDGQTEQVKHSIMTVFVKAFNNG